MSKKTDIDELVLLSDDEINDRVQACAARIETRVNRAQDANRDLTARESDLSYADRSELVALRDAVEIRSVRKEESDRIERQARDRAQLVGQAVETATRDNFSPLAVSAANLELLEQARRDYRSLSVIEARSALTTVAMGTAVEYSVGGLVAPQNLWRASGIPTVEPPAGYKATVPTITLPAGTALVNESTPHAEFDDVAPDAVTLGRTGAWSDLTAEANISTTLADLSGAHSHIIARDLDLAVVTRIEGTPAAMTVDGALCTVAAEAASDVSRLWIFGTPADVAALSG